MCGPRTSRRNNQFSSYAAASNTISSRIKESGIQYTAEPRRVGTHLLAKVALKLAVLGEYVGEESLSGQTGRLHLKAAAEVRAVLAVGDDHRVTLKVLQHRRQLQLYYRRGLLRIAVAIL